VVEPRLDVQVQPALDVEERPCTILRCRDVVAGEHAARAVADPGQGQQRDLAQAASSGEPRRNSAVKGGGHGRQLSVTGRWSMRLPWDSPDRA
jgi:hypothetical protein